MGIEPQPSCCHRAIGMGWLATFNNYELHVSYITLILLLSEPLPYQQKSRKNLHFRKYFQLETQELSRKKYLRQ